MCDRVPMFEKYFRFSRTPGVCMIFTVNGQVPSTMTCSAPIWTATSRYRNSRAIDVGMSRPTGDLMQMGVSASWAIRKHFSLRPGENKRTSRSTKFGWGSTTTMAFVFTAASHFYSKRISTAICRWRPWLFRGNSWQGRRVIGWTRFSPWRYRTGNVRHVLLREEVEGRKRYIVNGCFFPMSSKIPDTEIYWDLEWIDEGIRVLEWHGVVEVCHFARVWSNLNEVDTTWAHRHRKRRRDSRGREYIRPTEFKSNIKTCPCMGREDILTTGLCKTMEVVSDKHGI